VSNKNFKKVNVLGVKIDDLSMDQAVELVEGWLKRDGKHYIVTPNPEFVMAAQYDPEFKKILNDADLAIPDGVGIIWALNYLSLRGAQRRGNLGLQSDRHDRAKLGLGPLSEPTKSN